jgi:hypothetical protein
LTALIDRIREIEDTGKPWRLHAVEIRVLLGVEPEAFYRRIYAAEAGGHPLISLSAASATYSQETIWEFVALVELFGGSETETRLQKAGIFFSHPEQLEIVGIFLNEAAEAVRSHALHSDDFSAMLRAFGSYERARDVYLREYFPLNGLIDRTTAAYCSARSFGIPQLAEKNVKRLLGFFFRKHVLEVRSVFAAVIEELLRQAVAEGYVVEQREERRRGERMRRAESERSSILRKARRTMNLEGRTLDRPLLKSQYKRLMKMYHPDINPRGLRRCQEITAAYSLLLSSL